VDNPQNVISFCTGYGGLELGIRRAGVDIRTVCNVEIEAFVQANLVAKIEEGRMDNAPIYSDLKTFPASIFRGKIHGICGGYPCQPFSSAGKRKGEEDPRHLWPYIRKHVRTIRPLWCFFENVRGHATMGLWRVLSDLEEDGYRTEWGLFSAEETGAPHQRIRCFILGRLGNPASLRPRGGRENREGEQSEVLGTGFESNGELANPARDDVEGRDLRQGEVQSRGSGTQPEELAHPASREPRQSQARNGGQDIGGGSEEELGDSKHDGLSTKSELRGDEASSNQRRTEESEASRESKRTDRPADVPSIRGCKSGSEPTRWPARPGEEQYEWEEPRVVADCKVKRCGGREDTDGANGEGISEQAGEERSILRSETEGCCRNEQTTHDEAQSELGGAVDGSRSGVDPIANRVDRLRLLGNGVVPQCAELAWRTLWKQLNDREDK